MRYLIGFGLIVLGGVLGAVTGFLPFLILMFVGVFLFASVPSMGVLHDYVIANTDDVLCVKRHYFVFLPFYIVSAVLTLGKGILLIPWKEEYFVIKSVSSESSEQIKLTRAEYIALRNQQREIYATQMMSKGFMERAYSPETIGLKHKKNRLILAAVFCALVFLSSFTMPGGIYLALIYGVVFIPMIILWIPPYQDAKILQQAYDRATSPNTQLQ